MFLADRHDNRPTVQMIHAEGIDSLSTKELQHACLSRGIRTIGISPSRLREELEQWIEFHYTNKISGVLLILSRAFHYDQQEEGVYRSLEATLSSLPDNLVSRAFADRRRRSG
jgi:LETM1 and EF-hand domain-containing protein 1